MSIIAADFFFSRCYNKIGCAAIRTSSYSELIVRLYLANHGDHVLLTGSGRDQVVRTGTG